MEPFYERARSEAPVFHTPLLDAAARSRRRLAELKGGERLFLPSEVVDCLDQLRALGVSERSVQIERDGWIMLRAHAPERVRDWATEKGAQLADPAFRQLYLSFDEAFDWDPADPRLTELADAVIAFLGRHPPDPDAAHEEWTVDDLTASLVRSSSHESSAAHARLSALCQERLGATSLRRTCRRPSATLLSFERPC